MEKWLNSYLKTDIEFLGTIILVAFSLAFGYCFIYITENNPSTKHHAHKPQEVLCVCFRCAPELLLAGL